MVESAYTNAVFVGVDWGNSHHQVCVLDAAVSWFIKGSTPTTSPVSASSTSGYSCMVPSMGSR